ncbi:MULTISPECIES: TonB-dependent receptor plug domain-containing protein [Sphingomonas]|jgi:outer membrane receptor protein involved in Fe transport|uniref:TonB-dependent receptor n=1 Tax=Sphingomonas hankookensis TaxID=563996 RepID=A0ABR5YES8_9SPHN|nr:MULTISPECIES: TonB-dependent receptor [Sphingomonas]KZE16254.1 TonB-dependent receptor [Sphingomonas hankookensis]PZT92771.1 MAG: TonB-dependent receptor [Sphingomonas sp.]WCP71382.1 TonB-dependent receptor [Sphingomonas hankookensis]
MKQPISRWRLNAARSVLAMAAVLAAASASAQDAPATVGDEQATTDPAEEIVVTGSRIVRPELEVASPIVSVTAAAIEATGLNNITDVLIRNPALSASVGGARSGGGSPTPLAGTGANFLNLRNLGTNRTLVLVNGRRHVAGVPNTAAVDINSIPQDLIQQVDVLTGGASAVYGADGVSGVVNFVLRRDFEGVTARLQAGISDDGDAGNQLASIVAGKNFAGGRGNVTAAYEYSNTERLSSFARPFSGDPDHFQELWQNINDFRPGANGIPFDDPNIPDRILYTNLTWADSAPDGAVDLNLDGIPDFTGSGLPYDGGTFLPGGSGRAIGGTSNTPTAGYFGDLYPAIERHAANLLTSFEFSDKVRFFAEGKFVRTRAYSVGQPSFDFYTYLMPDNAFLNDRFGANAAPNGAFISRDNFDFGIRGERVRRDTWRGVVGFDGEIAENTRYEISYVYGRTSARSSQTSNPIGDRYYAAIDAVRAPDGSIVCRSTLDPSALSPAATTFTPGAGSPCRPLNLLGNGVASQAALDFVLASNVGRALVDQHVVSGSISGDSRAVFELPGGPIGFAFGAEYRRERSRSDPDPFSVRGEFRDSAALPPSAGSFDVKEVFGEVNVPLLANMRFADLLSFGAAARVSDYSTVGSTRTWKFDGIYAPIRDIRFRGSYSQAVRAPNIGELFLPTTGTFGFVTDPCDLANRNQGTQYREANCRTLLAGLGLTPQQIATFTPSRVPSATTSRRGTVGGNRNLAAEIATTWTAGVALQPRFIPGLTITADWYDIRIRDAINTPSPTQLAQLCVDQPTINNQFCANVFRSTTTGYVLGDGNDPQRRIGFNVGPANVAAFRTSGADFAVNYTVQPGKLGRFDFNVNAGYLDHISFVPTVGADVDDNTLEQYNPRWRGSGNITWTLDALSLNYGLVYFSKTRRFSVEELANNPDLSDPKFFFWPEMFQHDIRAEVRVNDRFRFYGGVNNLFEQTPIWGSLNYPISGVGRFLYAGATMRM